MATTASQTISVGALSVRFVLDADASGGSATAFECEVPANAVMAAPPSHDGFDETNYGLAGVTTFTVDGEQHELHPGGVVFVPRGAVHAFANCQGADARFLAVVTPGLLGPEYFHEIAAALAGTAGGPPDLAAIDQVMRRHGLTPAVRGAESTAEPMT